MRDSLSSHPSGLILTMLFGLLLCHAQAVANPLARTVTIYRDIYGVPHVFGRTDASTVFGFAYAQAEDNFWRVEENFISALGRSSEVYGEKRSTKNRLICFSVILGPGEFRAVTALHKKC